MSLNSQIRPVALQQASDATPPPKLCLSARKNSLNIMYWKLRLWKVSTLPGI